MYNFTNSSIQENFFENDMRILSFILGIMAFMIIGIILYFENKRKKFYFNSVNTSDTEMLNIPPNEKDQLTIEQTVEFELTNSYKDEKDNNMEHFSI
jgi:hypothetical protein